MKQLLIFIFFTFTLLNANIVDEKVKNIIGEKEYKVHQNLIKLLFKNKNRYITSDNKLKYYNIFKQLRDNGLLNLRLDRPQKINLLFKLKNKPLKSYKLLKDTLHALGYRYFVTNSFEIKQDDYILWNISVKVEYMIDSVVLLKELQLKNCKILNIQRENLNNWFYEIDFQNSIVNEAIKIEKNEKVKFQKPLKEYFIKVDDAKSLQIISRNLNNWFPYIVFFDKNLEVLKIIKKNRIYKGYRTKIPKNTKYIKITDVYNLINIKRGLSIIVR